MKNPIVKIFAIAIFALLISCSDDDVETEYIIGELAGTWVVTEACDEGEFGPYTIQTYNTAFSSTDSMYIENIYDSEFKVAASISGNKFSVNNGPDVDTEGLSYTIEGEVFNSDSIAYTITLIEEGEVFDQCTVSGHRFTGLD